MLAEGLNYLIQAREAERFQQILLEVTGEFGVTMVGGDSYIITSPLTAIQILDEAKRRFEVSADTK